MITGLGIDIVEIERVAEKLDKNKGFREKVFSKEEISFCESATNSHPHYAGRFAAKEAFLKATGDGLGFTYELHLIEILPDKAGKPVLKLNGILGKHAEAQNWRSIHVSISHTTGTACAVVIIES